MLSGVKQNAQNTRPIFASLSKGDDCGTPDSWVDGGYRSKQGADGAAAVFVARRRGHQPYTASSTGRDSATARRVINATEAGWRPTRSLPNDHTSPAGQTGTSSTNLVPLCRGGVHSPLVMKEFISSLRKSWTENA